MTNFSGDRRRGEGGGKEGIRLRLALMLGVLS